MVLNVTYHRYVILASCLHFDIIHVDMFYNKTLWTILNTSVFIFGEIMKAYCIAIMTVCLLGFLSESALACNKDKPCGKESECCPGYTCVPATGLVPLCVKKL